MHLRRTLMAWSAISYLLMLAVMQFNVWFFIAILIGLGVGELGFGTAGLRGCQEPSRLHRPRGCTMVQRRRKRELSNYADAFFHTFYVRFLTLSPVPYNS
jgi:hypothetical protein